MMTVKQLEGHVLTFIALPLVSIGNSKDATDAITDRPTNTLMVAMAL